MNGMYAMDTALKKIRETCISVSECAKCPYGSRDGGCFLANQLPSNWKLRSDDEIERFFE